MSSTDEPEEGPLISHGTWQTQGKTNATIIWKNDKPDASIGVALLNQTTLTLSADGDVIKFKRVD